jgi:phage/plasmid-like protein (TIGR03299 family)
MSNVISENNDLGSIAVEESAIQSALRGLAGGGLWDAREYGISAEQAAEMLRAADTPEARERVLADLRQRALRRANLDASTGKVAVFVAGTPAWHRLGKVIDQAATSEEAIKLAVLDWVVEKRQLFLENGTKAPGAFATVRTDTGAVLGTVGSKYVPFQNSEAFKWLDALVGEGLARYETAGSLDGGKRVWMLLRLPREVQVGENDQIVPYVLLTNSHDGSGAIRVIPTSVRTVCQNTLNMALRNGDRERGLYIRHTKNVAAAVEEAREKFGIVLERVESFAAECQALAGTKLTEGQARDYLERLYPTKVAAKAAAVAVPEGSVNGAGVLDQILSGDDQGREVVSDLLAGDAEEQTRTQKRNARIVEQILENYQNAKNNLPGIEGTAWSLLNATTEYLDHQAPVRGKDDAARANSRLNSIWFGAGAERKEEAFELALELAQAGGAQLSV